MVDILTGAGPGAASTSLLWLKAFGIQAAIVSGPHSTEFWKPYVDPRKFEGVLPVLWRADDVTIYKVPQRTATLAHVIPQTAAASRTTAGLPRAELEKYVAALDDPSLPTAQMGWDGFRRMWIRTTARKDQVVSIQTGYHPGWHALANGAPAEIDRDGLGFILIRPQCDGPCHIQMNYDGGWEYRLCRWLSALTILGILGYSTARGVRDLQSFTPLVATRFR